MKPDDLFRRLYLIRRVEEEIARVYSSDKIQSPVHLSIGQELASVAVCGALAPSDKVFGSYRSHALYLAKGGNLRAFLAELYGKSTGCARGKGGSMHMVEASAGLLGTSAIVGSLIPVAVGYAWAQKRLGTGVVTAVFFGDGAAEEGCFFEAMNFAALHKLPILFVCENNGYAITSPIVDRQSSSIERRARAFGLMASSPFTFEETVHWSRIWVDQVRRGDGPGLLEITSQREREHVGPAEDWAHGYRARDPEWEDPLVLAANGVPGIPGMPAIPIKTQERIRAEVDAEIADAFAFAESSPVPGPDELMEHLYA